MTAARRSGSLIREAAAYMAGQGALLLLSLVTFPLFARLLSRAEYGQLALVNSSLSLTGLVLGLGLPNAVVRFLPGHLRSEDPQRAVRFNTGQLAASVAVALAGSVAILVGLLNSRPEGSFAQLFQNFQYVVLLLVSRAAANIALEYFRVARRTVAYNAVSICQKVFAAIFAVCGFLWTGHLYAFLLGMTLGETLAATVALVLAYRSRFWAFVSPAWEDIRGTVKFSLPLMLTAVCTTAVASGSRYFIQAYHGAGAVATYAIAFDLCTYVQVLFVTSFRLSILPELVDKYSAHGPEEAARFIQKATGYFAWLVFGIGFGLVAVGTDVITILASSRYSEAGALLPYLVPAVLLNGMTFLFASGLYLQKRNELWFAMAAISLGVNLAANALLIPRFGLQGAAATTLVTYAVQAGLTLAVSNRFLPTEWGWKALARTAACGGVMWLVVTNLKLGGGVWPLAAKVFAGATVYSALLLAVDPSARSWVKKLSAVSRQQSAACAVQVAATMLPMNAADGPRGGDLVK